MDKCDGERSKAETRGLRVMVNGVGSGADQARLEKGLWGQCGGTWKSPSPDAARTPSEAWHIASGRQHTGVLMSRESEEKDKRALDWGGLPGPSVFYPNTLLALLPGPLSNETVKN